MRNKRGCLQQFMYHWSQLHPYNAVGIVGLRGSADPARLRKAASDVVESLGISRLLVDPDDRYFRLEPGPADVSVETLSCDASRGVLEERASAELNHRYTGPALPIRLFISPGNTSHHVGLAYNHWIADGHAINYLIHRIISRYLGLSPSQPAVTKPAFPSDDQVFSRRLGARRTAAFMWDSIRDLLTMRYCHSPSQGDRNDLRVETRFPELPVDILDRIKVFTRARGITVGELLLASLAEAISANTLERLRWGKRNHLAFWCAVDLRPYAGEPLRRKQGMYLGYAIVICRNTHARGFDSLLGHIRAQTSRAKAAGRYLRSLVEVPFLNALWPRLSPGSHARYYGNQIALAGGLSNQRVPDHWFAGALGERTTEYRSAASAGPVAPLTVSAATCNKRLTVSFSWRLTGYPRDRVDATIAHFCRRLESL